MVKDNVPFMEGNQWWMIQMWKTTWLLLVEENILRDHLAHQVEPTGVQNKKFVFQ